MSPKPESLYDALQAKFAEKLQNQYHRKITLTHLCHALEDEVLENKLNPVIFAAFQDARYYQPEAARYEQLKTLAKSVTLYGKAISAITTFDQDWFVVINEPRFKAIVASKEIADQSSGAEGPDSLTATEAARPFVGLWSYEREVVDYACQYLAQSESSQTQQAVQEAINLPHNILEQLRLVHNVSERILRLMEKSHSRSQHHLNHNQHLTDKLEEHTTRLNEMEHARQVADFELGYQSRELHNMYDELTRSQNLMVKTVMEKMQLENTLRTAQELVSSLSSQLTATPDQPLNPETTQLLKSISTLLQRK